MKLATIALLGLLAASAAGAQQVPVGSGVMVVEERLRVGGGCESYRRASFIGFSVFPNGTFLLENDAGRFRGFLSPANSKGSSGKLRFDDPSRTFYGRYLVAGVRALCAREASLSGRIESFVLRVGKDGRIFLRLSSSVRSSAPPMGHARHLIHGSGALGPLPSASGFAGAFLRLGEPHGATITMVSPSRLEDPSESRAPTASEAAIVSWNLLALTAGQ